MRLSKVLSIGQIAKSQLAICSIRRSLLSSNVLSSSTINAQYLYLHRLHKRFNTTDSSGNNIGFANESLYHVEADRVMDIVTAKCDDLFDLTGDEFDYRTASGVLNIDFGANIGTWVLNKQAPNQQLWLSSPVSGPNHYDYDTQQKKWVSSRDGHSLNSLLSSEFSKITASEIEFEDAF